jgi:hypothetical protein
MAEYNLHFTSILLFSWLSVLLIVALSLVVAVLSKAYKFVKDDMFYHSTLQTQDYEMVEVLINRLKTWMGKGRNKKKVDRNRTPSFQLCSYLDCVRFLTLFSSADRPSTMSAAEAVPLLLLQTPLTSTSMRIGICMKEPKHRAVEFMRFLTR